MPNACETRVPTRVRPIHQAERAHIMRSVYAIVATVARTRRNSFLLIATLSLLAVAIPSPARADCDSPRSALTALKQSDVVFRGAVREMKTIGEPARPNWKSAWIVTLDVSRVWKGLVGKQFVLHLVREDEDDAFENFAAGSEYLVFSTRNSQRKTARFGIKAETFGATGCSGTTSLPGGLKYLMELGPSRMPSQ
jgi:hypothetical protein